MSTLLNKPRAKRIMEEEGLDGLLGASFENVFYLSNLWSENFFVLPHQTQVFAIVSRDKLTTLAVTHSMTQVTHLGDRVVMMHRGRVIHDFRDAEKRRLRVDDLLARFEEVRRAEQIDETAAEMLRQMYA